MTRTIYIKRSYCHDAERFSLYEPLEIPKDAILKREFRQNCIEVLASDNKTVLFSNNLFVESFAPDENNILLSEYLKNPRYISAMTDHRFVGNRHQIHKKCEVLVQKRGGWTMVRCTKCGQESPLAINSLISTNQYQDLNWFECSK